MRTKLVVMLTLLLAAGCQTAPIDRDVCAGFKRWATAPAPADSDGRNVYFDWNCCSDDEFLFYAAMGGIEDEIDKQLYEDVAQLTHYVWLSEYSQRVAKCFGERPNVEVDSEGEIESIDATFSYRDRKMQLSWSPTYCKSKVRDLNGCFEISARPLPSSDTLEHTGER